jgi:sugar transferase (PEP-CTERM/EpsH1 system associated)
VKVLAIFPRFPYPIDKGDKLRAFHQLRELARNHEIYLFALCEGEVSQNDLHVVSSFCTRIELFRLSRSRIIWRLFRHIFSQLPFQTAYYFDRQARKRLAEFSENSKPDVAYFQLVRCAEYVDSVKCPSVLDFQDAMSENMKLRARKESLWLRPVFRMESNRLRRYEALCSRRFQGLTIISEKDKSLLPEEAALKCKVIGNGIDFSYYESANSGVVSSDIVFVGAMSYLPNVDAAEYLVHEILPRLASAQLFPKVCIVGADPSPRVLKLASAQVEVTGRVEDTRPYYRGAKMLVAPMFMSTGVQNKILEAMSMGIPVITTPQAASALNGGDSIPLFTASDPLDFARHISFLLDHPRKAEMLAAEAGQFVRRFFSWHSAGMELEGVLKEASRRDY